MRILALTAITVMLMTLLTRLVDYFDQWLRSDTSDQRQNAVFEFIFAFCIALLFYKLLAAIAALLNFLIPPGSA